MSANTETTGGPPKGYVECSEKCGRWTNSGKCWTCCARLDGHPEEVYVSRDTPDWTPPIAAPVAHAERRKGQRWRRQWRDMIEEVTLLDRSTWTQKPGWNVAPGVALHDACWTDPSLGNTMTLLADAPPEPLTAKDVFGEIPPGSKLTNDTPVKVASAPPEPAKPACNDCSSFGTTGKHWFACLNAPKKSPPAQEAPKAAPVCTKCQSTDDVRDTRFDAIKRLYCKPCRSGLEAWLSVQTGERRTAGPALIDRRLAADWVEDCLSEAGR